MKKSLFVIVSAALAALSCGNAARSAKGPGRAHSCGPEFADSGVRAFALTSGDATSSKLAIADTSAKRS